MVVVFMSSSYGSGGRRPEGRANKLLLLLLLLVVVAYPVWRWKGRGPWNPGRCVITPPPLLEMDGEAEEQQSKMKTKRMAQQSSPGNLVRAIFAAGTNAGGGPILVLILLPIVSRSLAFLLVRWFVYL
jgi:hypothetical protein